MEIEHEELLTRTREKLRGLESLYEGELISTGDEGDEELGDITRESLTRLINQLKEEILRLEAGQPAQK